MYLLPTLVFLIFGYFLSLGHYKQLPIISAVGTKGFFISLVVLKHEKYYSIYSQSTSNLPKKQQHQHYLGRNELTGLV